MDEVPDPMPRPASFQRSHRSGVAIDYVPDELLVAAADQDVAEQALTSKGVRVVATQHRDDRTGVVRLGVDDGDGGRRLPEVLDEIHDEDHIPVQLHLVHWLHSASHIHLWPGSLPAGAGPARAPSGDAGRGVKVAVLDTGLAKHAWLAGVRDGASHEEIDDELKVGDRVIVSPLYGHGTFVAGVVHSKAPAATIVGRKLPVDVGLCRADAVADAVLALIPLAPDVVNLSWGCYTHRGAGTLVLERAVKRLLEALPGTVVVAAAGNDGIPVPTYPAAQKEVVAVGAVDSLGRRAEVTTGGPFPFDHWASNFGGWVDAWRLGVDVVGPYPKFRSGLPTFDDRSSDEFVDGVARWGGTSFAAPAFAGEVAARARAAGSAARAARQLLRERDATVVDLRETSV